MQFRKSLELKTDGRLRLSMGNVPYVLVLHVAFPRDALGTQDTGPGEPLVWPTMSAVIMSFKCYLPFFQTYSLLFYCFHDLFQERKAATVFFFPNVKNFSSCSLNSLPAIS